MTDIAANLAQVHDRIAAACAAVGRDPGEVDLLAVSKRHPVANVRAAYAAGQRLFGENRVQELGAKAPDLGDLGDLRWHMIGSLQTNKVRDLLAVPGLALLHSLDRAGLADALQQQLQKAERELSVLLQLNATGEESKHGCLPEDAEALLAHVQDHCPRVIVTGVMAMGPLHGDPSATFARVAETRGKLVERCAVQLPTCSLGMSGDLEAAIAAGSTLVRIGTAVFGPRP